MCQKDGIFDTFLSHSQDCRKKLKQMKEKGYNTYWYGGEGMGIYDAAGNKLRTTVGRQRVIGPIRPFSLGEGAEPQGGGLTGGLPGGEIVNPIPSSTLITTDYCGNAIYRGDTLSMLLTEEGYVTFTNDSTPVYHYYLKDHLGSIRVVFNQSGTVEQRNDYYASGALMPTGTNGTLQPYKFGGKDPVIGGRFTTMDPMAEKYYGTSPYAYCGGDPVNAIDPDGRDWYQNKETKYYTWFENKTNDIEGYTHIGGKGSVLGEFESLIDYVLINGFNIESLYSDGFTFDISPNDKGALIGSKERDWDFTDEFVNGTGPEFSVLLGDHPYTQEMKNDDVVLEAQKKLITGNTNVKGQITNYPSNWTLWDTLTTLSLPKQFIGSYSYDGFMSKDGRFIYNVISDSKSAYSALYHVISANHRRSECKELGNTYQFYIWKTRVK